MFFDYQKSKNLIEKSIKSEFNLDSSIKGKIKYNFLPSPRIKISKLIVKDFLNKKNNLGEVENIILKIPLNRLLSFNKIDFNKIEVYTAKINLNLNILDEYIKFLAKDFKSKNIKVLSGNINLLDSTNDVSNITDIYIDYTSDQSKNEVIFKGSLIGENIIIRAVNKKDKKSDTTISINYPSLNFGIKTKLNSNKETKDTLLSGLGSMFYGRTKLNVSYEYSNGTFKINEGKIKNQFLSGKVLGELNFSPFFKFNLNLDLDSLKITSLIKNLNKINGNLLNNLFSINEKINGNLELSINKIYSSSKIIKSLESRMQFVNKDILLEQMLLDLGKLGAADFVGSINQDDKNIKFKFKNNIFIDNSKTFFNKFGIYNKNKKAENIFISGMFNLTKPKIFLDEINIGENLKKDDIIFYQKEFNQIVLENGYSSLFKFYNLKEFMKTIFYEPN
jgi:hypothetical protein